MNHVKIVFIPYFFYYVHYAVTNFVSGSQVAHIVPVRLSLQASTLEYLQRRSRYMITEISKVTAVSLNVHLEWIILTTNLYKAQCAFYRVLPLPSLFWTYALFVPCYEGTFNLLHTLTQRCSQDMCNYKVSGATDLQWSKHVINGCATCTFSHLFHYQLNNHGTKNIYYIQYIIFEIKCSQRSFSQ